MSKMDSLLECKEAQISIPYKRSHDPKVEAKASLYGTFHFDRTLEENKLVPLKSESKEYLGQVDKEQ